MPAFSQILSDVPAYGGAIGYLLLLFTPGAWIAFGLDLNGLPFWTRLLASAMLSPLVACAQFYILRLSGVAFGSTCLLLVVLNLPALWFAWKRYVRGNLLDCTGWVVLAAILVPFLGLAPLLIYKDARIFSPHGWYHADVVYMFARGDLRLEDPTLAGEILPYPVWSPLAFQAVVSFLVNAPPQSCYLWVDLISLIAVYGFAAGITKELGGGKLAQITSGIWLITGTTPIAYLEQRFAPGISWYCCDVRYASNWVTKFELLGPMALALGMLMALIYLLVRPRPPGKGILAVICLLVSGIGVLYPLLLPPACVMIAVTALAPLADRRNVTWLLLLKSWIVWVAILLAAILLTYVEVRFLTSGRLSTTKPLSFSGISFAVEKTKAAVIVTLLFLAGLAFTFRRCLRLSQKATLILVVGALGNYLLYAVFHLPFYDNEYKFIFAVTLCLAPFPAIALERIAREWPRSRAIPSVALIVILVFGAYGKYLSRNLPAPWSTVRPGKFERTPQLDTSQFVLRLAPNEHWAGVCDAVRRMTPANAIVLINNSGLYYPEFIQRSLYVSAARKIYQGINVYADELDSDLRGYGREIIKRRRATLSDFFNTSDAICRKQAIEKVLELNRPVAVVAEPQNLSLLEWLHQTTEARQLYAENGFSLWLIEGSGGTKTMTARRIAQRTF